MNAVDRMLLIVAGLVNRDRKAGREELHGFDFMDMASIEPLVTSIRELQMLDRASKRVVH